MAEEKDDPMQHRRGESFRPVKRGELEDWAEQASTQSRKRAWYQLFCGNPQCPSRLEGKLHDVPESDLEAGEERVAWSGSLIWAWVCPACRRPK